MIEKILLRAPKKLKDALQGKSKQLGVSMNALILQILWDWSKEQEG